MKRIILFWALLPSAAVAQIMLGQSKTIDGDTFVFGDDMVRIHGIDAVEADQTCERDGQTWGCGEAATQLLRSLLSRGRLRCQQMDIDQYDRQVSRCRAGGKDLGLELVASGLAVALPQYSVSYIDAEERARTQGVGIWGGPFQMPADYRAANANFTEPRPVRRRTEAYSAPDYSSPQPSRSGRAYYHNCDAARAAGAAPIRRGEPGYRPPLDADSDGIACEPYPRRR